MRPSITQTSASILILASTALGPGALAGQRDLNGIDITAPSHKAPTREAPAADAPQVAEADTPGAAAPADTKPDSASSPPAAKPAETKPVETKPVEAKPAETKPTDAKAPDTKAPAAKTPGTEATVVNMKTIEGVMGKSVRSRDKNEDMGRIVDVLVDGGGQIRAAVIDFGGFLGVGSRKVAVAWKTLDFTDSIKSGSLKVTLTRDQVRQSPEYKPDEPIVILEGAPTAKPAGVAPPPGHNEDAPPR